MAEYIITEDRIRRFIADKKFEMILELLTSEQNQEIVEKDALNIVSIVCSSLKEDEDVLQDEECFRVSSDILCYLAGTGNAKEVLMGLLEGADSFKSLEFFHLLLPQIKDVLARIPGKRGKTLDWVLDVLSAHLMSIPAPENTGFDEEEILLLDLDPNVFNFSRSLENYLVFLKDFVEEVSINYLKNKEVYYSDRIAFQREIMLKHHLKLLESLVYHDLHTLPKRHQSSLQASSEKIMSNLAKMCTNLFSLTKIFPLLEVANSKEYESDSFNKVSVLAFANLSYLLLVENHYSTFRPYVYSPRFLFEMHVPCISALLQRNEELALYKGLRLCDVLLRDIDHLCLPGEFLSFVKLVDLSNLLFKIAIYCEANQIRSMAISIINIYFLKFNWEMRYRHLLCVMNTVNHAGAQGIIITFFKDFLLTSLKDKGHVNHFVGRNLKDFLNVALILKDGAETDILENFDRIVCGLNLLRFISIWDQKDKNETGLWDLLGFIKNKFLKPLATGVQLTRAHYGLEANQSKEQKRHKNIKAKLMVNGEDLPSLPPECKIEVINRALLSLDVIEGLMTRLQELLNE